MADWIDYSITTPAMQRRIVAFCKNLIFSVFNDVLETETPFSIIRNNAIPTGK